MTTKVSQSKPKPAPRPQTTVAQKVKKGAALAKQGNEVRKAATEVYSKAKELPAAMKSLRTDGFVASTKNAIKQQVADGTTGTQKLTTKLGVLKKAGGVAGDAVKLAKLPGTVGTAVKDVRTAARTRSAEDRSKAVDSSVKASKDLLTGTKTVLETTRDGKKIISTYRESTRAFRQSAPNASKALVRKVGIAATRSAVSSTTAGPVKQAVRASIDKATAKSGSLKVATGTANRAAARAAVSAGEKAAVKTAVKTVAKSGASTLARAAGRFAPGVNVAIAGYDVYQAQKDVRDPNASTGKKITSVITAAGSVVSATNIPVVSQIGAGVSTVSSLVGGFFYSK